MSGPDRDVLTNRQMTSWLPRRRTVFRRRVSFPGRGRPSPGARPSVSAEAEISDRYVGVMISRPHCRAVALVDRRTSPYAGEALGVSSNDDVIKEGAMSWVALCRQVRPEAVGEGNA